MIISHEKQFVLMSPWKAASSTCHLSLDEYDESPYPRFFHFNKTLNRVVHQHVTINDLLSLPEGKLGYKLASFVRNPYDRAYSGFLQIQRDFEIQTRLEVHPEWIESLIRTQISENMSRVIASGFDFNSWICMLPEYELFESGRNTNMALHPCHYWTHVDGEKIAQFIGRVEKFDDDFQGLCDFVGIEKPAIRLANVTEYDAGDSIEGYRYAGRISRKALDRINGLFASDFEIFGYRML